MDCLKNLDKKKISPIYKKIAIGSEAQARRDDPDIHYLDGAIYALDYAKNPEIKAAIRQLKYKFTQDLAQHFANLIAEKIRELNMVQGKQIVLIPVPLHKKRLNYRGFNQAEVIAKAVASRFSDDQIEVLELLERIRHTDQQAKLDKYERRKNLDGAFSMNTKIVHDYSPNNIYFLVDDVFTTGSTLESCAKTLKENGFKKVYGLVVARAFK